MRPFLLLAFAPLLLAQPARAADFTIPAVIAFDGSAPIEADIAGRLSGQVTDGKLVVHAQDQHGGRKLDYSLDGAGVPTAAVDVTGIFDPDRTDQSLLSGAGLIMKDGGDGDAEGYLLFVVTKDNYVIRSFTHGDFAQSLTGSLPEGVAAGKTVRLAAREKAEGVEFFVNGESVGSLSEDGVTGSGMGLIYLGRGTFTFDNFAMNLKGEIPPGGPTEASVTAPAQPPVNPPPAITPPPAVDSDVAMAPNPEYYVAENGQPVGPLKLAEMIERIKTGKLRPDTLVWKPEMPKWGPANTVPALAQYFTLFPPPSAPPQPDTAQ